MAVRYGTKVQYGVPEFLPRSTVRFFVMVQVRYVGTVHFKNWTEVRYADTVRFKVRGT